MHTDLITIAESKRELESSSGRVKIHIRCRKCGEVFILRGIRDVKGHVETGFRRCLCDNDKEFDVQVVE